MSQVEIQVSSPRAGVRVNPATGSVQVVFFDPKWFADGLDANAAFGRYDQMRERAAVQAADVSQPT